MKRSDFLKKLCTGVATAIVAPSVVAEALKQDEKPKFNFEYIDGFPLHKKLCKLTKFESFTHKGITFHYTPWSELYENTYGKSTVQLKH